MTAGVTRINGLACTVGIPYMLNCKLYRLVVKNVSDAPIDLRAEDDAVNEVVEFIVKELNPLAFEVTTDNTGYIMLVMDVNSSELDIATRIRNMGSSVGVNSIDVRGTQCALARTNGMGGLSITNGTLVP